MKPFKSIALSLSLSALVACQISPLITHRSPETGTQPSLTETKSLQTVAGVDIAKSSPEAQISHTGQSVHLRMQLPPLPESFRTQALDLATATKIRVKLTDSNGNLYPPDGADVNGDLAYPVEGNFSTSFSNVPPDRLIVAEFEVRDNSAQIPQTQLALAFQHLSNSTANLTMNMSTSPTGRVMKTLLGSNRTRARAINLTNLQSLVDTITGKAGTAPALTYTTHPELVKIAQLATDLATQDPTALTAADYRFTGATVNATVSGLVATDKIELQVSDASSALKTNAGNGLQSIVNASAGAGLTIQARNSGTPGTSYTYNLTPSSLTLTEGGTQAVTVTATPATPSITSLSSNSGSIGSSLTITGTNFHTATAGNVVKFGTTTATVTAASATSLTVTVPAGISGTQNVTVQVGTQLNSGTHNFAVTPVISSLSTAVSLVSNSVTITGTGFDSVTPANNIVKFGTTTAAVTGATTTSVTATVPAGVSGTQAVTTTIGAQVSNGSNIDILTLNSSNSSNAVEGTAISLSGAGFHPTHTNNTVKFSNNTVATTSGNSTTLNLNVPDYLPGKYPITVTRSGVTTPALSPSFTIPSAIMNQTTAGTQTSPKVAMNATANKGVFVWEDRNGTDGSGNGIYARTFDLTTGVIGSEFRVNTSTTGDQSVPDVAMDSSGRFTVVWESDPTGTNSDIYFRVFNANGTQLVAETRANTTTTNNQDNPYVRMNNAGQFAVGWRSDQTGDFDVYFKMFNTTAGSQAVAETRVNTSTTGTQTLGDMAMNSAGKFVFVWHGPDADSDGIWFRVYNANGTVATNQEDANSTTSLRQSWPRVDYVGDKIAMVWQDAGLDGNGEATIARVFWDNALTVTNEIQVNTTTAGNQGFPKISLDSTATNFVAIYQGSSVVMRRFSFATVNGTAQSGEVTVNATGGGTWVYHDNNNDVMPVYSDGGEIYIKRYLANLSGTL